MRTTREEARPQAERVSVVGDCRKCCIGGRWDKDVRNAIWKTFMSSRLLLWTDWVLLCWQLLEALALTLEQGSRGDYSLAWSIYIVTEVSSGGTNSLDLLPILRQVTGDHTARESPVNRSRGFRGVLGKTRVVTVNVTLQSYLITGMWEMRLIADGR